MKNLLLLIIVCLALTACLKDDLDTAALTTNPLDPAYDGTPLVVLVSDTVKLVDAAFPLPPDTVYQQTVRVRTELLSPLTGWSWQVTNLSTGEVVNSLSNSPTYTSEVPNAHSGLTYCFKYTLIVQYTPTKPYTICGVAHL